MDTQSDVYVVDPTERNQLHEKQLKMLMMKNTFYKIGRRKRAQYGASLVGILAAVAVSSIILVVMSKTIANALLVVQKKREMNERALIRQRIVNTMDCNFTLGYMGADCVPGTEQYVAEIMGLVLVPGPGYSTFLGKYQARAVCLSSPAPVRFQLEIRKIGQVDWNAVTSDVGIVCEFGPGVREWMVANP